MSDNFNNQDNTSKKVIKGALFASRKARNVLLISLGTTLAVGVSLLVVLDPLIDDPYIDTSDYNSYFNQMDVQYIDGKEYKLKDNINTYCLIGIDKDGSLNTYSEGHENADFISYVVIDNNQQSYTILHINRDTLVTFNKLSGLDEVLGTLDGQIALSHAFPPGNNGSARNRNTINALKKLFSNKLPVDEYMGFTMSALERFNDIVAPNGLSLTITSDMYDDAISSYSVGQTISLTGLNAVSFVRARTDSIDGNVKRMARQKAYMDAFKNAADSKTITWSTLTNNIDDYIDYNIDVENIDQTLSKFKTYTSNGIISLDGTLSSVAASSGEGNNVLFTASKDSINSFLTTYLYDRTTD